MDIVVDSNVSYEKLLNLINLEHQVANKCVFVDLDGQEIDKKTFNEINLYKRSGISTIAAFIWL